MDLIGACFSRRSAEANAPAQDEILAQTGMLPDESDPQLDQGKMGMCRMCGNVEFLCAGCDGIQCVQCDSKRYLDPRWSKPVCQSCASTPDTRPLTRDECTRALQLIASFGEMEQITMDQEQKILQMLMSNDTTAACAYRKYMNDNDLNAMVVTLTGKSPFEI